MLKYAKVIKKSSIYRQRSGPARHRLRSGAGRRGSSQNAMFYTYVLRSTKDSKLYIGWTPDLKNRIIAHNKGFVEATKYRRPLELVYYEACLSKVKSLKREKYFKTGFGRNFLNQRI